MLLHNEDTFSATEVPTNFDISRWTHKHVIPPTNHASCRGGLPIVISHFHEESLHPKRLGVSAMPNTTWGQQQAKEELLFAGFSPFRILPPKTSNKLRFQSLVQLSALQWKIVKGELQDATDNTTHTTHRKFQQTRRNMTSCQPSQKPTSQPRCLAPLRRCSTTKGIQVTLAKCISSNSWNNRSTWNRKR